MTAKHHDAPLFGLSQRLPPANLEAEQALLGAILANNRAYERVSEFLLPEHFADPVHGRIYSALATRIEAGQLADGLMLKAEFENTGILDEVGGMGYLAQLLVAMVSPMMAGEYGRAVHDAWLRRELIAVASQMATDAFGADPHQSAANQLESAEQSLFALGTVGSEKGGFVDFGTSLAEAMATAERAFQKPGGIAGLPTGLTDLDRHIGGMHPSDLIILGGRPGMGKTALAVRMAVGAAKAIMTPGSDLTGCCAFFSLEMSAEQLATRIISEECRISGDRIRRGDVTASDFARMFDASRTLATMPLTVDDTAAITLSAMRTRCRRLKRTKGLALIVVDYLQLMTASAGKRPENRVHEISQISQGLKALAKEMEVPVLALSQLSRQVENREDKRPQLADLRESGSIEQDADMVMFVYRDEYYLRQRAPKPMNFNSDEKYADALSKWERDVQAVAGRAEVLIEKQRHGPTGMVELAFEGEFTRFADLEG